MFFFYRPSNKFPRRVFGEAAHFADDPTKSSLDEFSFGYFSQTQSGGQDLPAGWELVDAQEEDLASLRDFYQNQSGGLMLNAFDLLPGRADSEELSLAYERIGFTRRRRLLVLTQNSDLKVFFEVNLSDAGMNMSDLMNCVRIIVVDSVGLNTDIMGTALCRLADNFPEGRLTVMTFPAEETAALPFPETRRYVLWIWDLQFTDTYFAYMSRLARFMGPTRS